MTEKLLFTEAAQRALSMADAEAKNLSHPYIGTEHLLLGTVAKGDTLTARALEGMGVTLPKVRAAVAFIIGRGEAPTIGPIKYTPRVEEVFSFAGCECRQLGQSRIGPEHIMLGLIKEGWGIGAGVLESLGVRLEVAREKILEATANSQTS